MGLIIVSATVLGWSMGTARVWAQKNDVKSWLGKRTEITKILRDRDLPADQEKLFDDFFKEFFLQQFVEPAPGTPYSLDKLPEVRRHLKIFLTAGGNKPGTAHDRLAELALAKMSEIIQHDSYGPYDSAIKANAMLVIGDLNKEEGDARSAKPLPEAFPVLLEQLQSPKAKDYLRVAALVGLTRWAVAGAIPQAKAADLTKTLLELVSKNDPPAGRDPAVHDHMRRSAAQVLATMGNPGPNNSVLKAFEAIVNDPQARPTLRGEIAQCIGQLKYPANAQPDYQALASEMGHQMLEICEHELDTARLAKRNPQRRLIMYSIHSVLLGLNGLQATAGSAPGKKYVTDLAAKLKTLQADLDSTDLVDDGVAAELEPKLKELQTILGPKPAVAKNPPEKKEQVITAEHTEQPVRPAAK